MSLMATMERPVSENMLANARRRFLAEVERLGAGETNYFWPPDDRGDPALRVLIVDDHRATTDTLFSLVSVWGHDVRRAYDGATGLKLAAAFRPHVLLLDMLLPDVSGFEVAIRIREQVQLERCFIIAITGRTDATHRAQSYAAGVDLFLNKPVAPADLQTLLSLESQRAIRHGTLGVTT